MIYLITGVPGSGKTLYAVSTLVKKLLAETVNDKKGQPIARRLVVDGVPDLIIPHEVMSERAEDSAPVRRVGAKAGDSDVEAVGDGLWNWWEWCQPGDVLLVDEVQRYWRPRGIGSKPPKEIQMLETHRHFGVDLVIITQNPMLIDQNVRRLVGRHLNVRRVFGGARAIVYDWDGCQADVHRTAGAVRSVWSYPKAAFKLYKSSELHTKQHQKIPLWFAFPLVVLALGIFAGPKAYGVLTGATSGKGIVSAPAPAPKSGASAPVLLAAPASAAASAPVAAASSADRLAAALVEDEKPEYMGCAIMRDVCRCYDDGGHTVEVERDQCIKESGGIGGGVILAQNLRAVERLESPRVATMSASDLGMIEAVVTERQRRVEAAKWYR
jgi:zona occludens toxin